MSGITVKFCVSSHLGSILQKKLHVSHFELCLFKTKCPSPHTHTHTHTHSHTQKAKPSAAVLAQSALEHLCTTRVIGVSDSAQAIPPGAGLVTHRRLYHVPQVKAWAPKVPPGTLPAVCDMDSW